MTDVLNFCGSPPASGRPTEPPPPPAYAELVAISNFSFLRGGSHPEELVTQALAEGLSGIGLADRNSLAGVVRAYSALKDLRARPEFEPLLRNFRHVVGARLCFADGTPEIVAYPADRAAYGRLCRLLTTGNRRAPKGECELHIEDLLWSDPASGGERFTDGQMLIVTPREDDWALTRQVLVTLLGVAPGRVWLAANCLYKGRDRARLSRLAQLAADVGVPLIATNDVIYHVSSRRILQDVLTCIREHLTITTAGRRLEQNAERHIKTPREMARLFREHPEAIAETGRLLARISFTLDDLRYNYPLETVGNGETAQETLERLTWEGMRRRFSPDRYPEGIPEKVVSGVRSELELIALKSYAPYFLTVHDLVRYARHERKILCQGRGSAANSMVCYCLEITEVSPVTGNLVFGRFLSTERDEPPDIDVDFEHERREEVMQYLYNRYSRTRTGLTATVVCYRSRGAMREVAKVFGLSSDTIDALNGLTWGWSSGRMAPDRVRSLGLDPTEATLSKVLDIAGELIGFPRHLSQHVGGFVITQDRLDHLIPIANAAMEDRTVVEWDKDDLDALGILKVDVLALGMLTCIRRAFEMMHTHYGLDLTLDGILDEEREDKHRRARGETAASDRVYAMTHRADTIGVFQIESRAQMSMLPRLKPREFYDFVIEVAIVRPGPIQGGMVHPYLKRRLGHEEVTYPSEALRGVLERTKGVPLFQEQAMQIAIVGAGFSPGEADRLRRAMATFRRNGTIHTLKDRFISGMIGNGYTADFAERAFSQIEGFGDYGFPESHAASFALLVYVSCWLKCHYPDVFACALLNSQPMGFYAPAQIVRDAAEHGVEMRPVDVNHSDWLHVLEIAEAPARERLWPRHADMMDDIKSTHAVRLGLSQVNGLAEADANVLVARRGRGYPSIRDLWLRTGLPAATLTRLAEADAFGSMGLDRRGALWVIRGLLGTDGAETLPLFSAAGLPPPRAESDPGLPQMPASEQVVHDYLSLTLSLKAHPLSFLRPMLDKRGTLPAAALLEARPGGTVEVSGLVLVRQRPGTATGVVFMTIEDETGIANIIVWPRIFEQNRRLVMGSRLVAVRGVLQREGLVIHVVAATFTDFTPELMRLVDGSTGAGGIGNAGLAPADEVRRGSRPDPRDEDVQKRLERDRQARLILPRGRNFH